MRVFIAVLVLIFSLQSWTKADDIQDFQIEGMSIGDSLLDYMTANEIKKAEENISTYPDSNYIVIFYNRNPELYDDIEIVYDQKDKKYIIEALTGSIDYPNKYKVCKKKKIEISEEFKIIFNDAEIYEDESPHKFAPDSIVDQIDFYPKSGGFARVSCTDWSEQMYKENGWVDNLKVSLGSEKFIKYLSQ